MRTREDEEEGISGPVLPGQSSPLAGLSPPARGAQELDLPLCLLHRSPRRKREGAISVRWGQN